MQTKGKNMKRKAKVQLPPMSVMALKSSDYRLDKPILSEDARRLHNEGKIHYVPDVGERTYMMPRSKEQILQNTTPQFTSEVIACIRKAQDLIAGSRP